MRKPMKPNVFAVVRTERQRNVLDVVNAIHDAGFSSVSIESQCIGLEDYYIRVIISQKDVHGEQLAKLQTVCDEHEAILSLHDDYDRGPRLSVWPKHG